jgi:hypothetical protein
MLATCSSLLDGLWANSISIWRWFFVAEDEKPSLEKTLKWTWTCSSSSRSWWIMIIMKKIK